MIKFSQNKKLEIIKSNKLWKLKIFVESRSTLEQLNYTYQKLCSAAIHAYKGTILDNPNVFNLI